MTALPKRTPGAHLPGPTEPPDGGWFGGTRIRWPTEDDLRRATNTMRVVGSYLEGSGVPVGEQAEEFFTRVLDGSRRLSPD